MKKIIALFVFLTVAAVAHAQTTISAVYVSASTPTSATIVWTTSTPSTSQVMYGTNISLPLSNNKDTALVTSHSMTLASNLSSDPLYYFAVVSIDGSGMSAQSSTYPFGLCGAPFVPVTGTINPYYSS